LQISGHSGPFFGKLYVNSPGNSNALRQIPCSIRNPEIFSPEQGMDPAEQGIYRELLHRPLSLVPFTIRRRSAFE
jgi:hypothetical protein